MRWSLLLIAISSSLVVKGKRQDKVCRKEPFPWKCFPDDQPSLPSSQIDPTPTLVPFSKWRKHQDHILTHISQQFITSLPPTPLPTIQPDLHSDHVQPAVFTSVRYIHPQPIADDNGFDPLEALSARTNYASLDCSAAIAKVSKFTKGASSILHSAKDRYMLTPCNAAEKYVVVELCEEVDVDTIVLANWEFFSSMFKVFRVSGSQQFPGEAKDWHQLGLLRAGNVRAPQVFKPPGPKRFFRYLRLDFISHYGSEHYCPISMLRVYGRNQLDVFRDEEAAARLVQRQQEQESVDILQDLKPSVSVSVQLLPHETPLVGTTPLAQVSSVAATSELTTEASSKASPAVQHAQRSAQSVTESRTAHATEATGQSDSDPTLQSEQTSISRLSDDLVRSAETAPNATTLLGSTERAPQQSVPTANTGESIYGGITKRLGNLEREAALTLRYIEDSGKLFQDIFDRLETRISLAEQHQIKFDQSLRRLSLEFELHRAKMEEDRIALAGQIHVLAGELVFGKRLSIGQMLALLAILALVVLTRGSDTFRQSLSGSSPRNSLFGWGADAAQKHAKQATWPSWDQKAVKVERKERRTSLVPVRVSSQKRHNGKRLNRYSPVTPFQERRPHSSAPHVRSLTPPPRIDQEAITAREPLTLLDLNSLPPLPVSPVRPPLSPRKQQESIMQIT